MSSDFHFLVPESFIQNLVLISKVVSEKIWFEFLYVHDFGTMSSNDLDLQYSHTFIYSIRCLLLLTFRSLAAIFLNQRTNGPVNAHLISWPSKSQNIQNLENIW